MADKNNKSDKKVKEVSTFESLKSFLNTVTENVVEGASVVTESIKNNTAKVYVAGSDIVEDANDKIHQYSDKVSLQSEKKKTQSRQKEIEAKFGALALNHYITNESLHKAYLTTKAIDSLIEEYRENIKIMIVLDKKIKKLNS